MCFCVLLQQTPVWHRFPDGRYYHCFASGLALWLWLSGWCVRLPVPMERDMASHGLNPSAGKGADRHTGLTRSAPGEGRRQRSARRQVDWHQRGPLAHCQPATPAWLKVSSQMPPSGPRNCQVCMHAHTHNYRHSHTQTRTYLLQDRYQTGGAPVPCGSYNATVNFVCLVQ
jgi:hypothetical protein